MTGRGVSAVVEGFVAEGYDEEGGEAVEGGEEAEVGAPANGLDEPGGEEGADEGPAEEAEDPDVDAAGALVEEEPALRVSRF